MVSVYDAPYVDSKFDEDVTVPANNAASTVQRLFNTYHGFRKVLISTAATAEFSAALAPRCAALYFYDAGTTSYIDLLGGANGLIDRSTAGSTGATLDAMGTTDKILIASTRKFRGLWIEVAAANGNNQAIAGRYSKNDGTWAALANESDGTDSSGTLAIDGNLTWDVPTDWGTHGLGELEADDKAPLATAKLYWVELTVDGALDADVELDVVGLLNEVAADVGGINMKVSTEYTFPLSDEVGGLELTATSTTPTACDITWLRR